MVILVMIFRNQLIGLFTDNPEIINIASTVLLLSIFLETGRTMNIVIINSLRAAGDAKFPVLIGVIFDGLDELAFRLFFRFPFKYGAAGIWFAIAADEWTRGDHYVFSDGRAEHGKNMPLLNLMSKMRVFLFRRNKIKVFLNEEKGGWISVAFLFILGNSYFAVFKQKKNLDKIALY